jgi:hypothetical protein
MQGGDKLHALFALPLENSPRCSLYVYMWLDGPQTLCGCYKEKQNLLPQTGIEHRLLARPARSLVAIRTECASGNFSIINSSCTSLFKPFSRLLNEFIECVL